MDALETLDDAERPRHRPFLIGVSGGTASGKVSPSLAWGCPYDGFSIPSGVALYASSANISFKQTVKPAGTPLRSHNIYYSSLHWGKKWLHFVFVHSTVITSFCPFTAKGHKTTYLLIFCRSCKLSRITRIESQLINITWRRTLMPQFIARQGLLLPCTL